MNHTTYHRTKLLLACALATLTLGVGMLRPTAVHAQSQTEMNLQAQKDFAAADADLNRVYKQLMARVDKKSQEKLKKTERSWIAYRDDQADLHADVMVRGGTMQPMDYSVTATALTRTRTHELEAMLKELASH